jgi:hypothetical protein
MSILSAPYFQDEKPPMSLSRRASGRRVARVPIAVAFWTALARSRASPPAYRCYECRKPFTVKVDDHLRGEPHSNAPVAPSDLPDCVEQEGDQR